MARKLVLKSNTHISAIGYDKDANRICETLFTDGFKTLWDIWNYLDNKTNNTIADFTVFIHQTGQYFMYTKYKNYIRKKRF